VKTEEELQQEIIRLLKEIEELRRKPDIVPTVVPDDPRIKELERLLKELAETIDKQKKEIDRLNQQIANHKCPSPNPNQDLIHNL